MRTEYRVNDMTIHRIVEQETGYTPMLEFLPTLSKETLEENLSDMSSAIDKALVAFGDLAKNIRVEK